MTLGSGIAIAGIWIGAAAVSFASPFVGLFALCWAVAATCRIADAWS